VGVSSVLRRLTVFHVRTMKAIAVSLWMTIHYLAVLHVRMATVQMTQEMGCYQTAYRVKTKKRTIVLY
jgi:hypothetical protein